MGRLMGGLLFSGIGWVALVYGKRQSSLPAMIVGVILMVYPYFVGNIFALYAIGIILTAALFVFRE